MNTKYQLVCMAFDGAFVTERQNFTSIQDAWEYDNDMGSRWYFYPFRFVTTASGKTIKDTPELLQHLNGLRTKAVAAHFKTQSEKPENLNMDAEQFCFVV